MAYIAYIPRARVITITCACMCINFVMYCVYLWQVTIGSVTVPSVVTTFSWLHLGVAVTPVTKNANAEFDWSRVHQNSHNYSIITYPLLISSTVTQTRSFILYWLYSFYQSTVVLCYPCYSVCTTRTLRHKYIYHYVYCSSQFWWVDHNVRYNTN